MDLADNEELIVSDILNKLTDMTKKDVWIVNYDSSGKTTSIGRKYESSNEEISVSLFFHYVRSPLPYRETYSFQAILVTTETARLVLGDYVSEKLKGKEGTFNAEEKIKVILPTEDGHEEIQTINLDLGLKGIKKFGTLKYKENNGTLDVIVKYRVKDLENLVLKAREILVPLILEQAKDLKDIMQAQGFQPKGKTTLKGRYDGQRKVKASAPNLIV